MKRINFIHIIPRKNINSIFFYEKDECLIFIINICSDFFKTLSINSYEEDLSILGNLKKEKNFLKKLSSGDEHF
ncbi:hypothetical protein HW35_00910 [Bacillus sp. X1(2014)]|nr:hypothetical protein HW35_00910 [Bacillus sp. X1(2014)]